MRAGRAERRCEARQRLRLGRRSRGPTSVPEPQRGQRAGPVQTAGPWRPSHPRGAPDRAIPQLPRPAEGDWDQGRRRRCCPTRRCPPRPRGARAPRGRRRHSARAGAPRCRNRPRCCRRAGVGTKHRQRRSPSRSRLRPRMLARRRGPPGGPTVPSRQTGLRSRSPCRSCPARWADPTAVPIP